MKKLFFSTLFLCLSILISNAQDVKFGGKAGLNIATLTGDDTEGVDNRISFHIGGVVEIPVSEVFSVQPELLYSDQGAEVDDIKIKFGYLNLPVLAKFYVTEGFDVVAGPQLGFLVSAEGEQDGISVDIDDFFKSIDFGIGIGAGYELENGINFGARYNIGITDLNDTDEPGELMNSVFQISVGYFFN